MVSCGNTNTESTTENQTKCEGNCSQGCTSSIGLKTPCKPVHEAGIVQVLSFHGKKRCITCNAIERLTREVVAEMNSEMVNLKVVDISLDENEELANKYEVTWSSLILDNGATKNDITQMAFRYAKNEPEVFKEKLKEAISKMIE